MRKGDSCFPGDIGKPGDRYFSRRPLRRDRREQLSNFRLARRWFVPKEKQDSAGNDGESNEDYHRPTNGLADDDIIGMGQLFRIMLFAHTMGNPKSETIPKPEFEKKTASQIFFCLSQLQRLLPPHLNPLPWGEEGFSPALSKKLGGSNQDGFHG